jgi:hypothetical protein
MGHGFDGETTALPVLGMCSETTNTRIQFKLGQMRVMSANATPGTADD